MFYILYGKDTFSRQQKLEQIKAGLAASEMLDVNTSVLDGQQLILYQLADVCNAVPFLASYRLVIVEGLLERFESKSEAEGRSDTAKAKTTMALKEWQGLVDYVKQMPPTTILILVDGDVKRNPLLKCLEASADVTAFPELKSKWLRDWIQQSVKEGGGTIALGAVILLADLVGGDLWAMSGEVDKLLAYCDGRSISEEDVRLISSGAREASIFVLVDAILEGKRKEGQQLLHQLLQSGASPSYILSMITRQLRLIVMAREFGPKLFTSEVRSKLERTSDYSLEKALRQAKAYTLDQIKKAYHQLLETDIAIKTGRYDGDLAINLLVIELCRG